MDPLKPGFFTSEFWLKALAGLAISILTWFTVAGGPLDQIAETLKQASPLLLIVVPLAKAAVAGFCAWCLQQLASKYAATRAQLKMAWLASSDDAKPKAA